MCSTLIQIQEKQNVYSLHSRNLQSSWAKRNWPYKRTGQWTTQDNVHIFKKRKWMTLLMTWTLTYTIAIFIIFFNIFFCLTSCQKWKFWVRSWGSETKVAQFYGGSRALVSLFFFFFWFCAIYWNFCPGIVVFGLLGLWVLGCNFRAWMLT